MKKILIVFMIAIVAACSMPETRMYSIAMPAAGKQQIKSSAPITIIVHSSRYLSQSYIASRVSPYQLDIARYSRWDAPPEQIVRDTLKDALSGMFTDVRASGAASPDSYLLDVDLRKFERADDGEDSSGELVMDAVLLSPRARNSTGPRSQKR